MRSTAMRKLKKGRVSEAAESCRPKAKALNTSWSGKKPDNEGKVGPSFSLWRRDVRPKVNMMASQCGYYV